MRKFGNLELIRAKFVDIFREDNKANAMHIEAVQSKSEREKKTELGKYTCRFCVLRIAKVGYFFSPSLPNVE